MTSAQEIAIRHLHGSRACDYSPFLWRQEVSRDSDLLNARRWDEDNSWCFPSAGPRDLRGPTTKDNEGYPSDEGPEEWMTSSDGNEHLRIALEMQDQGPSEEDQSHGDYIDNRHPQVSGSFSRICSECNTTKTPLWRSGPQGPKSLCNACGIRMRKARRAKAAALNGGSIPVVAPSKVRKEKTSACPRTIPFKKRCTLTTDRIRKSLVFEEFAVGLSQSSACHRLFPQDEKEAALLLMALSSGLIRG